MPSGPNLDLPVCSVFYEHSEGEGYENMKMSRHMGIGDIETHTDCPRYFWGIGSRLGHPSKYQNRPRARRQSHCGLPDDVSHANACSCGRNSAFLRRNRPKTNRAWSWRGKGWLWHGGRALVECFLPTRDPHSPSCGHFHTHFQKTQISRNTEMRRDKRDEGWAKRRR